MGMNTSLTYWLPRVLIAAIVAGFGFMLGTSLFHVGARMIVLTVLEQVK